MAARSSAAGQHRPGQHSAPARSGEIRQSPTYAAGILSQTRGDRRREIFWRVATRSPERDSSLRRRGRDGDSSFGVNSSAAKGERGKNTLGFLHAAVSCVEGIGAKPPGADRLPHPYSGNFARMGWEEAAEAGAGGALPALLSAKYHRTSGLCAPLPRTGMFTLS